MLRQTFVLLADLEGQLSAVTQDDDGHLPILRLKLLEGGKNKDGSMAHPDFSLAKDIFPINGIRNVLALSWKEK